METLRERIANGVYPPGTALPPQVDLADEFQVSQITIRRAISELTTQGLLYTGYLDGKRGTIVRSTSRFTHYATDALRPDRPIQGRDTFEESAIRNGRTPSKRFHMKIEIAPPDVADRLGVAHDELVVHRTLHQLVDGEPFSRETSYFSLDLAKETGIDSPHDIAEGTMRRLRDRGVIEVSISDEIAYESAGPEDAADLSVTVGSPLLVQTRTAATTERVTRVVRVVRLGERVRIVWEQGDEAGLVVIRNTQAQNTKGEVK
ncbi:GntR family transcriptional regulator [Saccharothrix obliqua]|uniref:GntR family transcriptional regulator n=1 Tax=Saccharothrix obliqua TaxID=2861747 RepID=UPI001C5E0E62|nr:GntR family transcriptional regulator [Saccharothrix obliqua]MBW4722433.1 GntR family transcriptional regulator [Saccharothrix obliqua]